MSTINKTFGFITLCVFGLGLVSTPGLSSMKAQGRDSSEKPADAATAKPAEDPAARIVLLTDGHIVKGVVREEETAVVVTQPVGAMRFPRRRIESVFGSIQEVYKYKLEQLPENDFDERMKLARWCLEQKMEMEARQQLQAIMELSPKHLQAKAMLVSLDQAQARQEMRKLDPEVKRSGSLEPQPTPSDRPGSLDASVIQGARRGMGISDLPVIFDLPTSQAVKRTDEFARFVHPVLQTYCARCHNEHYEGGFQLIQIRNRKELTREALRANLDATLKLIDRENPTRSDLLSSTLRMHGNGKNTRAIFQGSNDGSYRILAAWVNNLRVRKTSDSQAPARMAVSPQETGEAFAADRTRISRDPESLPPLPQTGGMALDASVSRSVRGEAALNPRPESDGGPDEFPIPFAISGKKPKLATGSSAIQPPIVKPTAPRTPSVSPKGQETPVDSDEMADPAAKKKPRKPLKLDPSILEKALQLRNQNR
jgi:hypothetical protein